MRPTVAAGDGPLTIGNRTEEVVADMVKLVLTEWHSTYLSSGLPCPTHHETAKIKWSKLSTTEVSRTDKAYGRNEACCFFFIKRVQAFPSREIPVPQNVSPCTSRKMKFLFRSLFTYNSLPT